MPTVTVGINNLPNALRAHFRQRQADLRAVALETCHRGLAHAVRLTDAEGLVDEGGYKAGFRVVPGLKGPELRNECPYAAVIEYGRRRMRPGPPVAPIREWVRRKLGLTGRELESATFLIRRAIHVRGTPPKYIMWRTHQAMKPWFREAAQRRLGR